jgi:hypothetical protein
LSDVEEAKGSFLFLKKEKVPCKRRLMGSFLPEVARSFPGKACQHQRRLYRKDLYVCYWLESLKPDSTFVK